MSLEDQGSSSDHAKDTGKESSNPVTSSVPSQGTHAFQSQAHTNVSSASQVKSVAKSRPGTPTPAQSRNPSPAQTRTPSPAGAGGASAAAGTNRGRTAAANNSGNTSNSQPSGARSVPKLRLDTTSAATNRSPSPAGSQKPSNASNTPVAAHPKQKGQVSEHPVAAAAPSKTGSRTGGSNGSGAPTTRLQQTKKQT